MIIKKSLQAKIVYVIIKANKKRPFEAETSSVPAD